MNEFTGLRVGVVGCGYWGSKHVRALSALDVVDKVVVIEPSLPRLEALSRTFPNVETCPALPLALDDVDAVVIATPPGTHRTLALAAIQAGKHVLVEKPLAASAKDARSIVAAARRAGVVLMVGHTFAYHSAVRTLREMVQGGTIGVPYYLDSARLNLGLYQRDVNVIFDLAPHDVSIANYVFGASPVKVECWASRHAHRWLEDVAHLRLHYADPAVIANVHVSWLDPCKVRRVTVVGSSKMVVFDDLATEERIRVHNKGVVENSRAVETPPVDVDLSQPPMSYRYGEVVTPYLSLKEPLTVEDEHFTDCVLNGTRALTDGESGLAVVEVLEAAQLSHEEGRAVDMREVREELTDTSDLSMPSQVPPRFAVSGRASTTD
ncbi:Gfo/Idh/MocA family oxidoreductase [Nocardioides panacis]|uniref:Gfo/Idh/MocA family oxidoreductase n=2 Tax=Nocardioides panacis TaxID=2849501 RepID=A0A975T401_9ACTN|nr:Gfo/Idh/MocA family oxidoreductase [Nocardioides panacis]